MVISMENNYQKEYMKKMKDKKRKRINAFISNKNYEFIDKLMVKEDLMTLSLSKGAILDLALTNLFISLDTGESLENIAINHLERIGGE